MFTDAELWSFIDNAGTWQMPNGWRIVIRAEIADRTVKTPHGLSYAVILQDQQGTRILGFDNSHDFDGAQDDDPYDHEHKAGRVGQRFRYRFKSPSVLVRDFFDRCEMYCERVGVPFEFVEDVV